jgi:hypothetical protein
MGFKKPGMSLGDAMKAASKHKSMWKKGGGQQEIEAAKVGGGGMLMGTGTGAGRRRRTAKKGGALYGFTGGPYTGSELSDGMGRTPAFSLDSMQWEGARPAALTGGRRSRSTRRRGSSRR